VPSAEIAFLGLVAIAIVSLLAIRRQHWITGEPEPIAVSLATGSSSIW
jgi:hypothetical protein